jgi:hypothetical protein
MLDLLIATCLETATVRPMAQSPAIRHRSCSW